MSSSMVPVISLANGWVGVGRKNEDEEDSLYVHVSCCVGTECSHVVHVEELVKPTVPDAVCG